MADDKNTILLYPPRHPDKDESAYIQQCMDILYENFKKTLGVQTAEGEQQQQLEALAEKTFKSLFEEGSYASIQRQDGFHTELHALDVTNTKDVEALLARLMHDASYSSNGETLPPQFAAYTEPYCVSETNEKGQRCAVIQPLKKNTEGEVTDKIGKILHEIMNVTEHDTLTGFSGWNEFESAAINAGVLQEAAQIKGENERETLIKVLRDTAIIEATIPFQDEIRLDRLYVRVEKLNSDLNLQLAPREIDAIMMQATDLANRDIAGIYDKGVVLSIEDANKIRYEDNNHLKENPTLADLEKAGASAVLFHEKLIPIMGEKEKRTIPNLCHAVTLSTEELYPPDVVERNKHAAQIVEPIEAAQAARYLAAKFAQEVAVKYNVAHVPENQLLAQGTPLASIVAPEGKEEIFAAINAKADYERIQIKQLATQIAQKFDKNTLIILARQTAAEAGDPEGIKENLTCISNILPDAEGKLLEQMAESLIKSGRREEFEALKASARAIATTENPTALLSVSFGESRAPSQSALPPIDLPPLPFPLPHINIDQSARHRR